MPGSPAPPLNTLSLLLALRRRWALALLLGLLGGAAAAASGWFLAPPPTYKARAMVHLASAPEAILNRQVHDPGRDFGALQQTQKTVVRSQMVLNAALKQPHVSDLSIVTENPNPLEWLTKEIEADFSMGPEILSISLAGDKPAELVPLVNAVMKSYLDEFANEEVKKRQARLEHLTGLKAQQENILKAKLKILESFAPRLGAGDAKNVQVWYEMKVKHLGQAKQQLLTVQGQIRKADIDLKGQERARERAESGVDITDVMVEQHLDTDPLIRRHLERVAGLEQEIAAIREAATAKGAEELLNKTGKLTALASARKALETSRQEILPKKRKALQDKVLVELDTEIAHSRYQTVLLREEETTLRKVIDDLAGETHEVGKDSFDMVQARADAEEADKVVRTLAREIQALGIELLAPPRARPLDEAIATKVNGPKKRLMIAGGAGGLGLAVVLVAVALSEFLARRVKSVEEVARALGVRLVGTLPAVPARGRDRAIPAESAASAPWQTHLTESVDSYRTMLLHEARAHSIRVVMVTSAVSGEGKTSLACHLAVSLARAGHNALLVDGDLRNPGADRHFGLCPGPGLSELLRGEIDLATAVRPTPTGGAWIMTAGKCDLRAIQCLGGDAMRSLFEQLRQQFDFVIVDSSPVLTVADPLLIGQHVDGVIFSVLCDVSRMPRMAAAQHRLSLLGIPTLGAVVIGTGETPYSPKYHWPVPDRDVFGVVASIHQDGGGKYPWSVPGNGSNQAAARNAG
jgi:capsular exopolysaccharide synthesis family protein